MSQRKRSSPLGKPSSYRPESGDLSARVAKLEQTAGPTVEWMNSVQRANNMLADTLEQQQRNINELTGHVGNLVGIVAALKAKLAEGDE